MAILIANWLIVGYFLVLLTERIQSVLHSLRDPNVKLYGSGFNAYVYSQTFISIAGFIICLFINTEFTKGLFSVEAAALSGKATLMLAVTIGVILLSGMVHTEYTIPTVQFISYGLLIVAMVIYTVRFSAASDNKALLWVSLVYLICLSMAIPVVYKSAIPKAKLFHIIEAVVSVSLVAIFTWLTYLVFIGQATNLFFIAPIAVAAIGDAIVIAMRWKEEKNMFVLVALAASVVMWIVGTVVSLVA